MELQSTVTVTKKGCPDIAQLVIPYIVENFAEEISLADLAEYAGMNRFHFCRRFQKECDITPMRWLWNFRALLAAEFIRLDPNWSLTDIAFACGFTSSAHFSRAFKKIHGLSPSRYRREVRTVIHASIVKARIAFDDMFTNNAAVAQKTAHRALVQYSTISSLEAVSRSIAARP